MTDTISQRYFLLSDVNLFKTKKKPTCTFQWNRYLSKNAKSLQLLIELFSGLYFLSLAKIFCVQTERGWKESPCFFFVLSKLENFFWNLEAKGFELGTPGIGKSHNHSRSTHDAKWLWLLLSGCPIPVPLCRGTTLPLYQFKIYRCTKQPPYCLSVGYCSGGQDYLVWRIRLVWRFYGLLCTVVDHQNEVASDPK